MVVIVVDMNLTLPKITPECFVPWIQEPHHRRRAKCDITCPYVGPAKLLTSFPFQDPLHSEES